MILFYVTASNLTQSIWWRVIKFRMKSSVIALIGVHIRETFAIKRVDNIFGEVIVILLVKERSSNRSALQRHVFTGKNILFRQLVIVLFGLNPYGISA